MSTKQPQQSSDKKKSDSPGHPTDPQNKASKDKQPSSIFDTEQYQDHSLDEGSVSNSDDESQSMDDSEDESVSAEERSENEEEHKKQKQVQKQALGQETNNRQTKDQQKSTNQQKSSQMEDQSSEDESSKSEEDSSEEEDSDIISQNTPISKQSNSNNHQPPPIQSQQVKNPKLNQQQQNLQKNSQNRVNNNHIKDQQIENQKSESSQSSELEDNSYESSDESNEEPEKQTENDQSDENFSSAFKKSKQLSSQNNKYQPNSPKKAELADESEDNEKQLSSDEEDENEDDEDEQEPSNSVSDSLNESKPQQTVQQSHNSLKISQRQIRTGQTLTKDQNNNNKNSKDKSKSQSEVSQQIEDEGQLQSNSKDQVKQSKFESQEISQDGDNHNDDSSSVDQSSVEESDEDISDNQEGLQQNKNSEDQDKSDSSLQSMPKKMRDNKRKSYSFEDSNSKDNIQDEDEENPSQQIASINTDQNQDNHDFKPKLMKKKNKTIIRLQTRQFKYEGSQTQKGIQEMYKDFLDDDPNNQTLSFGSQSFIQKIGIRKQANKVRTQRYTALTWAPLSLLYQFKRVSNIYFLLISILTFLPFTPKEPSSMIGTFIFVLDFQRYKQDKEVNNKTAQVLNPFSMTFEDLKWENVQPGNVIKIKKGESAPADILILYSSNKSGLIFVDTMNLDGETNLKEKVAILENYEDKKLVLLNGLIKCEIPNENLEKWDSLIVFDNSGLKPIPANIKNLILRGSQLRNTSFGIGIVVYTGMDTKIMKNLKKPKHKISNIMRLMNKMLYTVFAFQLVIIIIFAGCNVMWVKNDGLNRGYLDIVILIKYQTVQGTENEYGGSFFIQLLVFWVAYSHMIPISLYVIIEMLKLGLAMFINKDLNMYDESTESFAQCINSDLVEELGQVEMIFSDKTGTLTQNQMIFRKCQINGYKYGEPERDEEFPEDGMIVSGIKQTVKTVKKEFSKQDHDSEYGDDDEYPYVSQFFLNMALCNTVMIEKKENKQELSYKATSPDELALVRGAKSSGIQLVNREKKRIIIYNMVKKVKEYYKFIAEFPFDADRKRMSVLVKDQTGKYILYSKGADQVMLERINYEKNGIPGLRQLIEEDLYNYSCQGYRTLVMTKRVIYKEEYKQFKKICEGIISSDYQNKDERLSQLYDTMEQRMRYLGVAAIEDKLQEGVAISIEQFIQADIRFFMLTGDKMETAVEIAKSCKIIQDDMAHIVLNKPKQKSIYRKLEKVLTAMQVDLDEELVSLKDIRQFQQTIIIDGTTLSIVLSDQRLTSLFFHTAIRSRSVVCCRMSPKQKADVVTIFKHKGKWITLAIGDGVNDVSMLIEADIGVGIKGKEGTQATRAADFAITQFQFLMRLILFHGRQSYLRVSKMICYYFYKNVVLVFTELYFPFYNGFSGQIFFLDWLPMMFNAIFTSWYCLFTQLLETDVNDQYSYRYPVVYKVGQLGKYFNYTVFWKWILLALYHGAICFYFPMISSRQSTSDDGNGKTSEHWVRSTISFSAIIHLVLYKLLIETIHLNWISISLGVFSILLYYFFILIGQIPSLSYVTQSEALGVFQQMVEFPNFWLIIIALPLVCLIPDLVLLFVQKIFYPTPVETILSIQLFDPHFDFRLYLRTQDNHKFLLERQKTVNFKQRQDFIDNRRQSVGLIRNTNYITKDGPINIEEILNKQNNQNDKIKPEHTQTEIRTGSSEDSNANHSQSDNSSTDQDNIYDISKDNSQMQNNSQAPSRNSVFSGQDGDSQSQENTIQEVEEDEDENDEEEQNSGEINESSSSKRDNKRMKENQYEDPNKSSFDQSSRSLNMSIRSNHQLVNVLYENTLEQTRKNKRKRGLQDQSVEDNEAISQKQKKKKISIFTNSYSNPKNVSIKGSLSSMSNSQAVKVTTKQRKLKGSNKSSNNNEEYQSMMNMNLDKKTDSHSKNSDDISIRSVPLKSKGFNTPHQKSYKIQLFQKIFKNSNKEQIMTATASAFDSVVGLKSDKKDIGTAIVEQILNGEVTNRGSNINSSGIRVQAELVKAAGHPLESQRGQNGFITEIRSQSPRKKKKYVEKYSKPLYGNNY